MLEGELASNFVKQISRRIRPVKIKPSEKELLIFFFQTDSGFFAVSSPILEHAVWNDFQNTFLWTLSLFLQLLSVLTDWLKAEVDVWKSS